MRLEKIMFKHDLNNKNGCQIVIVTFTLHYTIYFRAYLIQCYVWSVMTSVLMMVLS